MKIEFLHQFFDDAFADVAEGSDIIGIDLNMNGHEGDLAFSQQNRLFNNNTFLSPLERHELALFLEGVLLKRSSRGPVRR